VCSYQLIVYAFGHNDRSESTSMVANDPRLAKLAIEEIPDRSTTITANLLDYLLTSDLRPGDRLPSERNLAEATGIPRSAIREALKAIGFLGLIDVRPGSGTFLRSTESALLPKVIEWGLLLGARSTDDILEARAEIEVSVARLAATRRSEADAAELRRLIEAMRHAVSDSEAFRAADVGFHLALARASGNVVLADMLSNMQSLLQMWSTRTLEGTEDFTDYLEEHSDVFDAVEAQDPDAAAEAMRRHMNLALARIRSVMLTAGAAAADET